MVDTSAFVARSPSRSASPLTARCRRTTRAAAGHLLERPVDQFALDHRRIAVSLEPFIRYCACLPALQTFGNNKCVPPKRAIGRPSPGPAWLNRANSPKPPPSMPIVRSSSGSKIALRVSPVSIPPRLNHRRGIAMPISTLNCCGAKRANAAIPSCSARSNPVREIQDRRTLYWVGGVVRNGAAVEDV
jgi:hypothetical protein